MSIFAGLPQRHFGVISADCPWGFKTYGKDGHKRSAERHYPTMKTAEMCALPVADLAAPDCFLFFWTSGPHMKRAFKIIDAWGFRYSSIAFTWIKLNPGERDALFLSDASFHVGMGYTTRKNTEICLLATRGKPKRRSKSVRELIIAARREHSRKPDEAARRIEQFASGPYLELFAREQRPGWTAWGNETDKFGVAA